MVFKRATKEARLKFERASLEHLDALYASALKLTRTPQDAEELVQDTYLKAFRFVHKFEWGTNLKAWLFRIQTNTFINEFRHKRHERHYLERAAAEPIYDEVFDREAQAYATNPETHAFTRFFKEDLERALDDLPDDFRVVVVLADIGGLSYKEIADMLGCPIGTVMSRLHRGRRLLQRELVDYAVEAGIRSDDSTDKKDSAPTNIKAYRHRKEG
ncbi:MAG: sigma-70 family RNA polymerase sigma factor [Proteobacteria bacterium]|nr:sigma-70 family RNA polymerase sigma factor [Pseudomonadota bacterium]